jgi:hypothetical protein
MVRPGLPHTTIRNSSSEQTSNGKSTHKNAHLYVLMQTTATQDLAWAFSHRGEGPPQTQEHPSDLRHQPPPECHTGEKGEGPIQGLEPIPTTGPQEVVNLLTQEEEAHPSPPPTATTTEAPRELTQSNQPPVPTDQRTPTPTPPGPHPNTQQRAPLDQNSTNKLGTSETGSSPPSRPSSAAKTQ